MIVLSVHLITFNNENHIEETLKSVLNQKMNFNYEIVVGDDCSSDKTLEIIKAYEVDHPTIFNVKKNEKQLGILGNFKATLDRCQGKYVFDIAGDDLLKHDYALQKMVDTLERDDTLGFIDSGVDFLYESTNTTTKFFNKTVIQASKEFYKQELLLGKITPTGICFSRKKLYQHVDFNKYLGMKLTIDDYPILVDLAMNTNFKTINESLNLYRVHDTSYSHKKSFDSQLFMKNQMKNLVDYFNMKYTYDANIIESFYMNHYKELLFLAGYYEKKAIGRAVFKKIKSKSIKDYIHYFASQNTIFRKLVSIL
ncbi:glycosyltransferase family 2 protein [Tamlana agarivorans]|uniref:Glycosyltransferase family 2 protein n=1 Tax=Pseudotamlana agarivorans TaxID=481183 RepID=A0ACC5U7K9_9FLAO|nr:glycosyltransferase family 2 protein [Tamlana agarivorans]MBU2950185.1 glycosyltransferase family 2 protein [Tamlana agarivorans]